MKLPVLSRLMAAGLLLCASFPVLAAASAGTFKGQVQPADFVHVSASQAGRVEAVLVRRGERVAAGQALLRMEGAEAVEAQLAAARLELLEAEQAQRDLARGWEVERAQAQAELATLQRQAALAQDRLDGLLAPPDGEQLAQVRANLLLAGKQLEKAQDELRKVQKKFENRSSPIWYFVSQRTFRLLLAQREGEVAQAQRRYDDAAEKLDDLQAPPDAVDVAVAQAGVQAVQAKINDALRRLAELAHGPKPEALEQARSRQHSAQAAQRAALQALEALSLKAPLDSVVVDVSVGSGEWLGAGQSAIVLADDAAWIVEAREVDEQSAADLRVGEAVVVRLDAYPELEITGRILQIGLLSREEEGDVYFSLKVELLENDPRLRWGLTARIETSP